MLPTWDESIWAPLQKKQFTAAERGLESLLSGFSLEDWEAVYWEGVFSGLPMVLGDLSDDDWTKNAQPALVRAVLNSANGKAFSIVLQNLSPDSQDRFERLFWRSIPGQTDNSKLGWLKTQRQSIYNFVIAAPGQDIGLYPKSLGDSNLEKTLKRYRFIPDNLRRAMYSYEGAETTYRTCINHHLSDDKTSQVAAVVGQVILGFVHPDDLLKTLQEKLGIDQRICDEIASDIEAGIVGGLTGSISSIYEPMGEIKPTAERVVSLENIGGAEEEESIPVETSSVTLKEQKTETPFILHEEIVPEGNIASQKSVFRSVTAPLGGFFLKKRPATGEPRSAFAKLEIPGIKSEEKRVVHYSETRTPLGALEEPAFLNVGEVKPLPEEMPIPAAAGTLSETMGKPAMTIKPKAENMPEKTFAAPTAVKPMVASSDPQTSPAGVATPAILGAIKKPEPKIEGNTVDLSNG